jgi:hypothetical protein
MEMPFQTRLGGWESFERWFPVRIRASIEVTKTDFRTSLNLTSLSQEKQMEKNLSQPEDMAEKSIKDFLQPQTEFLEKLSQKSKFSSRQVF